MSVPNLTTTSIKSHSRLLGRSVEHPLRDSPRCKLWGGLVAAVWTMQPGVLPWAAGAYGRFMARVPLNGGNLPKAEELQPWQRGGGVAMFCDVHDHDSFDG